MKTEKNIRKGFGLTGKIAMFCIGLVSFMLTSCESELEIQQSYPFTVETMPVPKELNRNETAEIRCELKSEGDFDGTVYTIRYFQYDGEGSLKLDNGLEFMPNDRYLLENRKFRLYFPKNNAGRDVMLDAPGYIDQTQLDELYLELRKPEE